MMCLLLSHRSVRGQLLQLKEVFLKTIATLFNPLALYIVRAKILMQEM